MLEAPVLIILAGGKSSRMGSPKGLLGFKDKPWILEQISRFKDVVDAKVYIGLGYDNNLYFNTIDWFKKAIYDFYVFDGVAVKIVINPHPEKGSFSTLQAVLKEVQSSKDVLVLPIDVPLLNAKELQGLIAVENSVAIPTHKDKNGHPVKLASAFWNQLITLDYVSSEARLDMQLKKVSNHKIIYLPVNDNHIHFNINTIHDWLNYLKLYKE